MGFFDRFAGASKETGEPSDGPQASTSSEVLHDEFSHHAATSLDDSTSADSRLYNPYEGLNTAFDGRLSRGTSGPVGYRLPKELEYVFDEEATVQKRSWSENICYYTGSGYLIGAVLGGTQGAFQAIRTKPEIGPDTMRLRINRFLNMSGKAGRGAGNALGVLGLFFSSCESGIEYFSDGRVSDAAASVLAGAATGAIYRSTRGPRPAAVAGAVGAVAASLLVVSRNTIARGL